jgi:InsA N-terminal domain
MVYVPVQCPHCHSTEVIKAGKQANGAQRYQCHNEQWVRRIFLLQYQAYTGFSGKSRRFDT